MRTLSFAPQFLSAMAACRYAVYGYLALLVGLTWWQGDADPSWALAYFVVAPPLLQIVLYRKGRRDAFVALHVIECISVSAMAGVCGLPLITCAMVAVVLLASNTALWGWRWLPVFILGCGGGLAAVADSGAMHQLDVLVDGLAGAGALVFLLVICAVAHVQAEQLVQRGTALRSEKLALLRYLPKEVVTHLHPTAMAPFERDWLTVAFVDLVGFSKATLELPAEALSILLNDFFAVTNDHVESWGGSISKFLGDGLLCVFASGGQHKRGNAARQAVRCVEQLPQVMNQLNSNWRRAGYLRELAVTTGVASGYCCTGHWGSLRRSDFTAIGTPVNLASRLQGAASMSGGILLDEVTATLVRDAVALGSARRICLKGMGERVAFPIGSPL